MAGYHTEYSSMKFAMFYMAEYMNIVVASALTTTLYLGGWSLPGFQPHGLLGVPRVDRDLRGQDAFLVWVFIWVRWTVPRFRYDQLMRLGWKVAAALALLNLLWARRSCSARAKVLLMERICLRRRRRPRRGLCGGMVVLNRNPVKSVLALVVSFFGLAACFVMLSAPFIAAIQVIVYAGAILVLFLFVLMLLNVGAEPPDKRPAPIQRWLGRTAIVVFGVVFVGLLLRPARRPVAHAVRPGGVAARRSRRSRGCCSPTSCSPSRRCRCCCSPPWSARSSLARGRSGRDRRRFRSPTSCSRRPPCSRWAWPARSCGATPSRSSSRSS